MKTSTAPTVSSIDHVHVYVVNRDKAEAWYARVLGFTRTKELEFWAVDGGPLTLQNADGTVHIALFERSAATRHSTIALKVNAQEYLSWRLHLAQHLDQSFTSEDHEVSLSMYFDDIDGNPYEITTYEHEAVRRALAARVD
jgi:catechol-2,3-dioxygenase